MKQLVMTEMNRCVFLHVDIFAMIMYDNTRIFLKR